MRPRAEIEKDGRVKQDLIIEVLLDIRGVLLKSSKKATLTKRKPGRPEKVK